MTVLLDSDERYETWVIFNMAFHALLCQKPLPLLLPLNRKVPTIREAGWEVELPELCAICRIQGVKLYLCVVAIGVQEVAVMIGDEHAGDLCGPACVCPTPHLFAVACVHGAYPALRCVWR